MLRIHDRILALVCGATAVGIVLFWAHWFYLLTTGDAGSDCYRAFENTFPPSDSVLAALLLYTARGLWQGTVSRNVAAFASGMLCNLSMLDLYWWGPGVLYTGINPGPGFIIVETFVLAVWLGLRTVRVPRDANPAPSTGHRAVAAGILFYFIIFTGAYWLNLYEGSHAEPDMSPCAHTISGTFLLADIVLCVASIWAIVGLALWTRMARFSVLYCAGGVLFNTLNVFTFALEHPADLGHQWSFYIGLSVVYLALITALVRCTIPANPVKG